MVVMIDFRINVEELIVTADKVCANGGSNLRFGVDT